MPEFSTHEDNPFAELRELVLCEHAREGHRFGLFMGGVRRSENQVEFDCFDPRTEFDRIFQRSMSLYEKRGIDAEELRNCLKRLHKVFLDFLHWELDYSKMPEGERRARGWRGGEDDSAAMYYEAAAERMHDALDAVQKLVEKPERRPDRLKKKRRRARGQ
jgi:hypothetical protein